MPFNFKFKILNLKFSASVTSQSSLSQPIADELKTLNNCPPSIPLLPKIKTCFSIIIFQNNFVRNIFDILGGGTPSTDEPSYWEDGTINWFIPTDVTALKGIFLKESSVKISGSGYKNSSAKMFPAYSVMMTSRATIGAVAINTEPATTNQGFITCLPNERFSFAFIYFWILHNKDTFEMLASGSTFLEIIKSVFKEIEIIVPTDEVLKAFDKIVLPLFAKIENLQSQITALRQMRDKLLPRLLSGQIQLDTATIG
jgi:type I restriction enzyme S subunit